MMASILLGSRFGAETHDPLVPPLPLIGLAASESESTSARDRMSANGTEEMID